METEQIAGARCCSLDGNSCSTPGTCPASLAFAQASKLCTDDSLRLCTKDELLSEVCCNTGGSCNHSAVWTSTMQGSARTTNSTSTTNFTTSTTTTLCDGWDVGRFEKDRSRTNLFSDLVVFKKTHFCFFERSSQFQERPEYRRDSH